MILHSPINFDLYITALDSIAQYAAAAAAGCVLFPDWHSEPRCHWQLQIPASLPTSLVSSDQQPASNPNIIQFPGRHWPAATAFTVQSVCFDGKFCCSM